MIKVLVKIIDLFLSYQITTSIHSVIIKKVADMYHIYFWVGLGCRIKSNLSAFGTWTCRESAHSGGLSNGS